MAIILRSIPVLLLIFSNLAFADSKLTYKIGITSPLSGPLVEYGVAVQNGINLALQEEPEDFSHIKFIFEDSRYDGKHVITVFNKLRTINHVDLIYDWGAATAHALAPLAEANKFPLIAMAIDPSSTLGKKYTIRFANYSEQYIKVLLKYFRDNNIKKIGIIRTELAYLNSMLDALQANLKEDETVEVIDIYNPGSNDFRSSISKIKKTKYDAVGVYLMSGQISSFYRQSKELKLSVMTFGTDFFESKQEIESSQSAIQGAIYPNNDVTIDFRNIYMKKYTNDTHIGFAANAYEFAQLVSEILPRDHKPSSTELLNIFSKVKDKNGALGRYSYTEDDKGGRYFDFPIVLKRILNGKILAVG